VAGEIMALTPDPPTPPRRSHRLAESRQERLARWRFDGMIAATALLVRAIERAPGRFPKLGPLELVRCTSLV